MIAEVKHGADHAVSNAQKQLRKAERWYKALGIPVTRIGAISNGEPQTGHPLYPGTGEFETSGLVSLVGDLMVCILYRLSAPGVFKMQIYVEGGAGGLPTPGNALNNEVNRLLVGEFWPTPDQQAGILEATCCDGPPTL